MYFPCDAVVGMAGCVLVGWECLKAGSELLSVLSLSRSPPGVHLPRGEVVRWEGLLLEGENTSSHDASRALGTEHRSAEGPLPLLLSLPFLITLKVPV